MRHVEAPLTVLAGRQALICRGRSRRKLCGIPLLSRQAEQTQETNYLGFVPQGLKLGRGGTCEGSSQGIRN